MRPGTRRRAFVSIGTVLGVAAVLVACSTVRYDELAEEYFNLGNAYYEAGDYERSYQYYTRALEYADEFPAAGFNLARLHIERDEPAAALEIIDELLVDDPENTLYLETRAYALILLDRKDEARSLYRRLLTEDVVRSRITYNLALLELESGDSTAALAALDAGAPFAEDDRDYLWLHAEAAFAEGREDEAIALLERFGYLVAEDPQELARLARRYAEWDFNLAALDLLDSFEPAAEDVPGLTFLKGTLLLKATDDFDAGTEAIERALVAGFRDRELYNDLLSSLPDDESVILREIAEASGFTLFESGEADTAASPERLDAEVEAEM